MPTRYRPALAVEDATGRENALERDGHGDDAVCVHYWPFNLQTFLCPLVPRRLSTGCLHSVERARHPNTASTARLEDALIVNACRRVPPEPRLLLAHLRRLSCTLSGQTLLMLRTN